jgi:hypothetical protein
MIDESFKIKLASGQPARLIPSVSDTKKEERVTSVLLASFRVVPAFALEVLQDAGAPSGKNARVECFTEVVFDQADGKSLRPDGLITIRSGSKKWTALIETKVGSAELQSEQVENYLDLAKAHGINALITISNQFVPKPSFHPVSVSKIKTRNVDLYHFSWISLVSKAILIEANKGVTDPEQVFILSELVRYLQHDASGVSAFSQMGSGWKTVCSDVHKGIALRQGSESVEDAVSSWQQLLRFLSLDMSQKISMPVSLVLGRKRSQDAEQNLKADIKQLSEPPHCLQADFRVPNAASDISLTADFSRRTLSISMVLEAPSDVTRATASINWLTRQLKSLEDYPVTIKADWPGRTPTTAAALVAVIDNPKILIPEKISSVPKALEVVFVDDLGARFQGAKTFVQATTEALPAFYSKVGQSLKAWIPKPPKIKSDDKKEPESQAEKNEIKQVNETQYYYFITGAEKQVGPVGESDILKISKENPTSDIRVWHEGLTSWTPFDEVF